MAVFSFSAFTPLHCFAGPSISYEGLGFPMRALLFYFHHLNWLWFGLAWLGGPWGGGGGGGGGGGFEERV